MFQTNDFFGFARSARLLADCLLAVKFIDFHFTSQQMRKARLFRPDWRGSLITRGSGSFRAQ